MTAQQVKEDLVNIRMYYRDFDFFQAWRKKGISNKVFETVDRYNNAMRNAPVALFRVYIGLYCEGQTRDEVACAYGYSLKQIGDWCTQLFQYLTEALGRTSTNK